MSPEEIESICEIRIRTETAKNTILLKISKEKLIKNLYEILKNFSENPKFVIISCGEVIN